MDDVLAWHGLRGWRTSVGDVPASVTWVVYVYAFMCLCMLYFDMA